jgi:hypothetical protein
MPSPPNCSCLCCGPCRFLPVRTPGSCCNRPESRRNTSFRWARAWASIIGRGSMVDRAWWPATATPSSWAAIRKVRPRWPRSGSTAAWTMACRSGSTPGGEPTERRATRSTTSPCSSTTCSWAVRSCSFPTATWFSWALVGTTCPSTVFTASHNSPGRKARSSSAAAQQRRPARASVCAPSTSAATSPRPNPPSIAATSASGSTASVLGTPRRPLPQSPPCL